MKKFESGKKSKIRGAATLSKDGAKASIVDNSANTLMQIQLKSIVDNSLNTNTIENNNKTVFSKDKSLGSEDPIQRQVGFEFQTNIGLIDLDQKLKEGATLSGDESRWYIVADDVKGETLGELEFVTSYNIKPNEIYDVMKEIQSKALELGSLEKEEPSKQSMEDIWQKELMSSSDNAKSTSGSVTFKIGSIDGVDDIDSSAYATGDEDAVSKHLDEEEEEEKYYEYVGDEEEEDVAEMDEKEMMRFIAQEHTESPKLKGVFSNVADSIRVKYPEKVIANPQATIDLQLSRINDLFILSGLGGVIPQDAFPRAKRWERSLSGENPEEGEMLYQIAFFVKREIAKLTKTPEKYEGIAGLSSLILSYLVSNLHTGGMLGYAKLIAPIMARTDFSSMWRLLPEVEKSLFLLDTDSSGDGKKKAESSDGKDDALIKRNYVDWLLGVMTNFIPLPTTDTETDPTKVFPKGYGAHLTGEKVAGPDRKAWLESIPGEGKDLLSPPEKGSASMGEKDATKIGHAIVELRRFKQNLPIESWADFAAAFVTIYEQLEFLNPEPVVK